MTIVFVPALIVVLTTKEKKIGRPLSKEEVESIRDNATAIRLTAEIANDMIKARGYSDIDPENVWEEWNAYQKLAEEK